MKDFFAALGFLTVLPVPRDSFNAGGRPALYFPLVGLLIGGLLAGVDALGARWAPPEVRAACDVLFLAAVSGALHLDGLADSADGLFSHRSREEVLRIMKDPRAGVMGVLGVLFCLILKWAALLRLPQLSIWLVAAPALARSAQAVALVCVNYAGGADSLSQAWFQKKRYGLLAGVPVALALPFYIDWTAGLAAALVFLITTAALLLYFRRRLGGVTGDTVGALSECVETAILLLGAIIVYNSAGP